MTKPVKKFVGLFTRTTHRFIYLLIVIAVLIMHAVVYDLKKREVSFLQEQLKTKEQLCQQSMQELRDKNESLQAESAHLRAKLDRLLKVIQGE